MAQDTGTISKKIQMSSNPRPRCQWVRDKMLLLGQLEVPREDKQTIGVIGVCFFCGGGGGVLCVCGCYCF